jgi:uncharacterized protein (TIGR01777 family)
MKILITGGTGMIGQALVRDLLARGHQVWVLTRATDAAGLVPGAAAAAWDGKTAEGWGNLVGQVDAIVHLAGANIGARPWTNERKRLIRSSRVAAGQAIVDAVRQSSQRPGVVIQIAGVGYYGVHGDEILDEQSPAGSDFLASVGADWENSTRAVTELGVRHVIMRTGVVLSPKGGVLAPFVLQNQLFTGGPLGSGRQWVSWIHINDLVRVINFLLEHPDASGVFNVTSPEPLTNKDFGRTVSQVMHRPFWAPVPAFILKLVLGEMSTLVLDGQRVLPKRLTEMGFQFEFDTLRKAVSDLLGKKH